MSRNASLINRLTALPPIDGLTASVAATLGRTPAQLADPHVTAVLGYHILLTGDLLAVYLFTDRAFALYETTPTGESFSLTVPTSRVRRVVKAEDATSTRLTIEIDADQTTTRSITAADGTTEGQVIPAWYQLAETSADGRASLRALHRGAAAALGL